MGPVDLAGRCHAGVQCRCPGGRVVKHLPLFFDLTGRKVVARLAVPSELDSAFERLYGTGKTSMDQLVGEAQTRDEEGGNEDLQQLKELASEAPIIRLVR